MSKSMWSHMTKVPVRRGGEGRDEVVRESDVINVSRVERRDVPYVERNVTKMDQLPERPRTSAGPAISLGKRKPIEKRETKDDLHFNPLTAHGKGTTSYNFPLPGALPTPASSPKSSPVCPPQDTVARPLTPDSMETTPVEHLSDAEIGDAIGMALGSPDHPLGSWPMRARTPSLDGRDSLADSWVDHTPILKHKSSKWRVLGGLFGAKKQSTHQTFYQLQPELPQANNEEPQSNLHDAASLNEKKAKRSKSERKATKNKSEIMRANTAPPQFPALHPELPILSKVVWDGEQHMPSLLDVDIPSIRMERYSIMFNGILHQQSNTTTSSLLTRRQATLDKLKTVDEALAIKERELDAKFKQIRGRSATSPSYTSSPVFSLFPKTSHSREPSPSGQQRLHPSLQRSNTSPAALSPNRPTFAPKLNNEIHKALLSGNPHADDLPVIQEKSEVASPITPANKVFPQNPEWSAEKSTLVLDSPMEHQPQELPCEKEDIYDPAPLPMRTPVGAPNWDKLLPPLNKPSNHVPAQSVSASTTSGSEHSATTSLSSVSLPPSSVSVSSIRPKTPQAIKQLRMQMKATQAFVTRGRSATMTTEISTNTSDNTPRPSSRGRNAATTTDTILRPSSRGRNATSSSDGIPRPPSRGRSANQITDAIFRPSSRQRITAPDPGPSILHPSQIPIPRRTVPSTSDNLETPDLSGAKTPELPPNSPESADLEAEMLKNAVDVSIARQISMSRQQRHLLVPIKTNIRAPSSGPAKKVVGMNGLITSVGKTTSPLSAVAGKGTEMGKLGGERLFRGVNPSTPTLVVVGEGEREWEGAIATDNSIGMAKLGLAERRRERSGTVQGHDWPEEIKIGFLGTPAKGGANRKSERVVVERVSVAI